ncbi:hypothetical protein [Shimia thalassica]|uniref:hypothetical protein n=1 Tax=Shimia thalassica TaxID=1715693 RepID=UPI002494372C|nr:hypothetical protein [Shimia thalassica]
MGRAKPDGKKDDSKKSAGKKAKGSKAGKAGQLADKASETHALVVLAWRNLGCLDHNFCGASLYHRRPANDVDHEI